MRARQEKDTAAANQERAQARAQVRWRGGSWCSVVPQPLLLLSSASSSSSSLLLLVVVVVVVCRCSFFWCSVLVFRWVSDALVLRSLTPTSSLHPTPHSCFSLLCAGRDGQRLSASVAEGHRGGGGASGGGGGGVAAQARALRGGLPEDQGGYGRKVRSSRSCRYFVWPHAGAVVLLRCCQEFARLAIAARVMARAIACVVHVPLRVLCTCHCVCCFVVGCCCTTPSLPTRSCRAVRCSDVNEVIQKFLSQDQQQASLKQLTKDNQARIEALNREILTLKERVDRVKYSGPGTKTVSSSCRVCPLVPCFVSLLQRRFRLVGLVRSVTRDARAPCVSLP